MTTDAPTGYRSGFVAIVGRPNVGKSTLMNRIVGEKVAIATPKPQTTRDRIRAIRTYDDWQVVFVDTPGIHEAKGLLNRYLIDVAIGTLRDVDLVYLLVDAAKLQGVEEEALAPLRRIVEAIAAAGTPTLLLLNKIDRVRDKAKLLPLIETLGAMHAFEEVVPISARTGDGLEGLEALTRSRLPEGPALFPEDSLTDRSLRFLAAELVREQLFLQLQQELPYHAAVTVEAWEEKPQVTVIHAAIHVAREGHKGMVIGRRGARLKEIGTRARAGLERMLDTRVHLELHVRVEERWTERPGALRKLGYDDR